MSTYRTAIGSDNIGFLVDPQGALGDVADHVGSDTGDVMVFDSRALDVLRDLPSDRDGSITDAGEEDGTYYPMQIWFEGIGYPIESVEA